MKNTYHIDIEASPDRVFYWLDDSKRVMEWAKGVVENEDLERTEERVGSTFRQVFEENGRKMEFQGRCTAYEANKRLGVFLDGLMFDLDVDYELEDLGGKTRLTQTSEVKWKGMMKLAAPMLMTMAKEQAEKSLERDFGLLKRLAEERGQG